MHVMQKKIATAMLLSSALMLPSLASAEQFPTNGQLFANRGACESALKQLRNTARQDVVRPLGGLFGLQGQAGAAANQIANPLTKAVCQAVSGQNGAVIGFKIVGG
jgi:hypothetical protein